MSEWRPDFDSQKEAGWRARQDEQRNITAETLAKMSEIAKKERAQRAIKSALEMLPKVAQTGARSWHVEYNHPDVVAYFEERGFSIGEANSEHAICIAW